MRRTNALPNLNSDTNNSFGLGGYDTLPSDITSMPEYFPQGKMFSSLLEEGGPYAVSVRDGRC